MDQLKRNRSAYLILLLPLGILLTSLAVSRPDLVEHYYASGFFKVIARVLNAITGWFPFSVGEVIIVLCLILITGYLSKILLKLVREKQSWRKIIWRLVLNTFVLLSVGYFGFTILWGLNYHRLQFAQIAHLNARPPTVQELTAVGKNLVARANQLRANLPEDQQGIMRIIEPEPVLFSHAVQGYTNATQTYSQLSGTYGRPKGVAFSQALSYTGIGDIYFPFSGEANVNTAMPDFLQPSTAAHEMAHQRGFAREDEANYIAYYTCKLNPDPNYQYSGTMLALTYTLGALYEQNKQKYKQLRQQCSAGVDRDLAANATYWRKYAGLIEKIADRINDLYLRSNRQHSGVHSYSQMVNLLVAEYRQQAGNEIR